MTEQKKELLKLIEIENRRIQMLDYPFKNSYDYLIALKIKFKRIN
jgi:hypothetical protein